MLTRKLNAVPDFMNPGFIQQPFSEKRNPEFINGISKMTRFKQQILTPLNGETVVRFHVYTVLFCFT